MSRTLSCPFLRNVTKDGISDLGSDLMKRLIQLCPHMRKISNINGSDSLMNRLPKIAQPSEEDKIPKEESPTVKKSFNYEAFFEEKITEKQKNRSYRVFKRINRVTGLFPIADSYVTSVPIERASCSTPTNVLVWCSNDYLGLSRHPVVLENAKKTIDRYGVGSGGTRNISGNQLLHEKLEDKIAKWYMKEAGLLFSSCYVANTTTLYTLAKLMPGCVILSDQGNHASMIEGIRNSRVPKHIYRHNDVEHLESLLRQLDPSIPKIVAFESLNSMNGSIAPIKQLCDVSHKYGAITFIDEVHAVGLYGFNGSGQGEHQRTLDHMDIISGTMGKAIGSMGGFIVGTRRLIDFIRSYGSGFIFTTSLPPVLASTALTSIDILKSDEGRNLRKKHQQTAFSLRRQLTKSGFPIFHSLSHILPVHVGNAEVCRNISDYLLTNHSMYVQAINHPTVKQGTERLRIAPTPHHTENDIENMCESLSDSWKACGQPLLHKKCCNQACSCISSCLSLNSHAKPITCV